MPGIDSVYYLFITVTKDEHHAMDALETYDLNKVDRYIYPYND